MLTGVHPFDVNCDRSDEEVAQAIRENPYPPLDGKYVGHLSKSAIDVIKKLMDPNPKTRMTAYQLLHHPWVEGETATTKKIEDSDKKLSHFQDLRHKLEASIFAVLVSKGHQDMTMSEARRKNSEARNTGAPIMKLVFDVFDEEKKGYVTGDDINRLVTEHTGEVLSSQQTNEFLKSRSSESSSAPEVSLSAFSKLFSGLKHKHYPRGHYIFHAGKFGIQAPFG